MEFYENNRLQPLKTLEREQNFTTFDIEAQHWNQFLMAGVYDGTNYIFCPTVAELVNTCLQRKYVGWIHYAHYGGGYDHRFILDYILKNREDLQVTIIEAHGLIMALDVHTLDNRRHWKFYDSYQVMKGGLDKLTQTFNVEHKKLTDTVDVENLTDTPETREYLRHDCIGLWEVIDSFYKLPMLDGIPHKMTTSSLSLTLFRQKYLQDTVLYKMPDDKEAFVREGYYGGRNEIFKMVGYNVKEYDINSMYVSAMLNPLPCGSKGAWAKSYDFNNPNTRAFIQAKIKTPANLRIPILPCRYNGKLLFPAGEFEGIFYSEELKYAIDCGYEIKVQKALIFPCAPFLRKYALDCWNGRVENPGDNPMNMTYKLFGNGIYGKFAQDRKREMLVTNVDFEEAAAAGWTLIFPEFGIWKKPTYSDSPAILPHISAAITAESRITLHKFLNIYPEQVLYCDTDSVFLEDFELPIGSGLGELKFENEYKRWIAIQPKFYLGEPLDETKDIKLRAKGFTFKKTDKAGNKIPIPWTFEDFQKALDTGNYKLFHQAGEKKMSKLKEAIRKMDLLLLVERVRSVQTPYSKRRVLADYSTLPYTIDEIMEEDQQPVFDFEAKRFEKEYRKRFREIVMANGGIRPSRDYDSLPRWCKRNKGMGIDVMVDELTSEGYPIRDADELYRKIWEV